MMNNSYDFMEKMFPKDVENLLKKADGTPIILRSTEIDKATILTLEVFSAVYEIRVNDELICTLNQLENASTVYSAIQCDMKGAVYYG